MAHGVTWHMVWHGMWCGMACSVAWHVVWYGMWCGMARGVALQWCGMACGVVDCSVGVFTLMHSDHVMFLFCGTTFVKMIGMHNEGKIAFVRASQI